MLFCGLKKIIRSRRPVLKNSNGPKISSWDFLFTNNELNYACKNKGTRSFLVRTHLNGVVAADLCMVILRFSKGR